MAWEGFSEKTQLLCTPSLAIQGGRRRKRGLAIMQFSKKHHLALFPNPAIGSSAHFRKSKTQAGAFGKKMSVRPAPESGQATHWSRSSWTGWA
jgi:hypothetical protein